MACPQCFHEKVAEWCCIKIHVKIFDANKFRKPDIVLLSTVIFSSSNILLDNSTVSDPDFSDSTRETRIGLSPKTVQPATFSVTLTEKNIGFPMNVHRGATYAMW